MIIAHVLTRLLNAGSEENTLLTCLGQAARGHRVFVVHGHEFNDEHYSTIPASIKLVHIPSLTRSISWINDLKAFFDLRNLFRDIKPHVVHTHQSKAGIVGRLAAASARVPTVVHGVHIAPFQGVGPIEKAVYLTAEKAVALVTDAYIDVSLGMKSAYREYSIGSEEAHHVVHSGFDLERFRQSEWPLDWRSLLDLNAEETKPPTIVMLAALEERKRHLEFIDRLPDVVQRVPNLQVLFAGEGPLRSAIEKRIECLALGRNAKLLGFRSDPEKLIALADVCVLASKKEGLPRAVLQYLAGGKPTVVSDLPGLSEVIVNNHNGLIIQTDDIDSLAETISRLVMDSEHRRMLSIAARSTNLGSWDSSVMVDQVESVYRTACSKSQATRHH